MIRYKTGNLLNSDAQALVNTVNTVGVMGKGIALQFKNAFPNNFKTYLRACRNNELVIGKMLVTEDESLLTGRRIIINFPTKTHWRKPSEYKFIEAGLDALVNVIKERGIKSVAVPPLGAGNGGLEWNKVRSILERYLDDLDCDIHVFEPNAELQESLKKERVRLTPARAMLLSVLYEVARNGEFVSEFAAEKIAYFLQRFGAEKTFGLAFEPNFYGPYSGKVKHILYYLNGSYLMGYSSKDKKPFEEIRMVPDAERDVVDFLLKPENSEYKRIADRTRNFLLGFYSPFAMELLSTVDFIRTTKQLESEEAVAKELENWSDRKKSLFTKPAFIQIAMRNLRTHLG